MKMEGEVLVLPPCFESVALGNLNHAHVFQSGLWLIYFHLWLCIFCIFAVTFSWFIINQPYNKMLRYRGVRVLYLGCGQWSLLKSQEGSWDFHSSFLPSQNCWWGWLQADGTAVLSYEETVKDWMSRIVGCIYFVDCIFFFSLCASLLFFHPALFSSNVACNDTGSLSEELSGVSWEGMVQQELYLWAMLGHKHLGRKTL